MSNLSRGLKPTNVRWLIVLMLVGFTFLGHFNRVSISVAGSGRFIGDGNLSEDQMGLVYSAFLLVYTIGMFPGGYVIDRIGPRLALAIMGLGLGFCTAVTGMVGWFGLSIAAMFLPLILIRGVAGASSVFLHPGAARAISLWAPLKQRSFSNGLANAGAVLGIAFAYPVFGWLMDNLDWQSAFIISGTTLMIFALIWYALAADAPGVHSWSNAAERELVDQGKGTPPRTRATFQEVLALFRIRSLVLLTLSYGALNYVQYLFFYWMEFYFKKKLMLPEPESREASFVVSISMAIGMACGGWIADRLCRWFGHRTGCRVIAFGGMGLCALFGLLGISRTAPREIILCFSLSFAAAGMCEAIFWTTASALARRNSGLACALLNTGGNGVGMLGPALSPIIADTYGWPVAIGVACSLCAVGGVLWLGIAAPGADEPALMGETELID